MLSLSDKEVKDSMKKNEEKLSLKFNTCLVLIKDIESVVKTTTTTWKNIYNLHQLGDHVVHIDDKDDEDDKDDDDEEDVETKDDVIMDDEEQEHEATEENLPKIQSIEETDPKKIVVAIMASFPHSPRKFLMPSSSEKVSTKLVVATTATPCTQPIFAPMQLSTILTEVISTSSTEQLVPPPSLDLAIHQQGISTVSAISTFVTSPSIYTIVSIPHSISTRIVEIKSQPSTKVSNKVKDKEEDIDLDEHIVIPNWDISTLNPNQMNLMGELLPKRAKQ